MPAIIAFAAWKNFGYNMIILLAALQAVPRELYEAARWTAPARCGASPT
jgi:multiple sugar transport system permease protein